MPEGVDNSKEKSWYENQEDSFVTAPHPPPPPLPPLEPLPQKHIATPARVKTFFKIMFLVFKSIIKAKTHKMYLEGEGVKKFFVISLGRYFNQKDSTKKARKM